MDAPQPPAAPAAFIIDGPGATVLKDAAAAQYKAGAYAAACASYSSALDKLGGEGAASKLAGEELALCVRARAHTRACLLRASRQPTQCASRPPLLSPRSTHTQPHPSFFFSAGPPRCSPIAPLRA